MPLIYKISKKLKIKKAKHKRVYDILFLNYIIVIFAILCFILGIIDLFFLDRIAGYILLGSFFMLSGVFLFFKITGKYQISSLFSLSAFTLMLTIFTVFYMGDGTWVLLGLLYPLLTSIVFGYKKGYIFSLIFLGVTIFLFIVPVKIRYIYSLDLKLTFFTAYLIILFVIQYFLRIKQQLENESAKKHIEIQRDLQEKNKLLSDLSYQIRTPLNNIAGITNFHFDKFDRNTIEEIEISISNLLSIANSTSQFSGSKSLSLKGKDAFFSINKTLQKTAFLFESEKYENLKCSLKLSPQISEYVYGDRLVFIQIIITVIDFLYKNKQSPKSLNVDLLSEKDTEQKIVVKITSFSNYTMFKKIIDKNSIIKIDDINNNELNVISELMKLINSSLEVKYDKTKTVFTIQLNFPDKAISKVQDIKRSYDKIVLKQKNKTSLKDSTILIVDDNSINSKVMSLNLERLVKKTIIANNGKEALEMFASTKIDLILMDIMMPGMNGYKTTEKIRQAEIAVGFNIPIIAVTANASEDTKERCFAAGMNDYTTKPINYKELVIKMKDALK